jgi:hypothetical protein
VESDQVRAEHAHEQLAPPRQDAEHLGRGKRNVQEEADARVGPPLAHQTRHEHQVIVVHPYQIARPHLVHDRVGEPLVHAAIGVPVLAVEREPVEQVVKERPDDGVREPVVVVLDVALIEIDELQVVRAELRFQASAPHSRRRWRQWTRPSDPRGRGRLVVTA